MSNLKNNNIDMRKKMKKFTILKILIALFLSMTLYATDVLPTNLKWITNDIDPIFASSEAKRGGTFLTWMDSFPITLRNIGPDANGSFRTILDGNRMSLTDMHPNTLNQIPSLATHWAYGVDNKSIYYKLNKDAKWSDGKPITADDYLFTLEFMRSKDIVDPWYNNYFTEYFDRIVKYDDFTIGVLGKKKYSRKEIHQYYNLEPYPRHFYKMNKDWVKDYNWKIAPNTGPYQISEVEKGKFITLQRKANWWGDTMKYYQNRFNVDKIKITIIRDMNIAYEHFLKGDLDEFDITLPANWHEKAKGSLYDNGYINRIWFYTDQPQSDMGMYLNVTKKPLDDLNVRIALAHALNIDKVNKTVLRNDYERLNHVSTGYGNYANDKIKAREFDLKKVDDYLAKSAWTTRGPDGIRVKNGERLSFEITYMAPHHTDRFVVLKEEAKKAGIELRLKLMDGSTGFKSIMEKQFEIASMNWSTGIIPQYWEFWHSKNAKTPQTNNIMSYSNPKMDKLIDDFDNEFNDAKKVNLAHEIQQLIHDDAAFIPTFVIPYFRNAHWRYWKFPKVPATKMSGSTFDLFGTSGAGGLFWLDQKEKDETQKARKEGRKFAPANIVDKTFKR